MALIQGTSNDTGGSGAATLVLTFSSATTADWLGVAVANGGNTTITSVVDSQAASWTKAVGTNEITHFWYRENASPGVTSLTITFPSAKIACAIAMERDDVVTSGSFDTSAAQNIQTPAASPATTNTTGSMAQANELGVAWFWSSDSAGRFTGAGSGWTAMSGTGITGGSHDNTTDGDSFFAETQTYASGGTATGTCTLSGSTNTTSRIVLFKLKTTGSGGSDQAILMRL